MKTNACEPEDFPAAMALFSGSSNTGLAIKIAAELNQSLGKIILKRFADGEVYAKFEENIRGRDVFLIQSTGPPVNDNWIELLIMIDAARRASASRITAVIPYFGYARQDRKAASREPITARLMADLLEASGVHRVLCVDLHSSHIQGFFDIPVDNLTAKKYLLEAAKVLTRRDFCIVAPDAGASKHAIKLALDLGTQAVIINKYRPEHQAAEAYNVIGDPAGKECVIIDDMIDTGGTICTAAAELKKRGGLKVSILATHGLFSRNAMERIEKSDIDEVFVSDSLPLISGGKKIRVVSIAPLIAQAIHHTHHNESVNKLFE